MTRSAKTSLMLEVGERVQLSTGKWQEPTLLAIRVTQESVFQQRRDQSLLDGLPITARFSTRHAIDATKTRYARWKGDRYKIRQIIPSLRDHLTIIELGEQT